VQSKIRRKGRSVLSRRGGEKKRLESLCKKSSRRNVAKEAPSKSPKCYCAFLKVGGAGSKGGGGREGKPRATNSKRKKRQKASTLTTERTEQRVRKKNEEDSHLSGEEKLERNRTLT